MKEFCKDHPDSVIWIALTVVILVFAFLYAKAPLAPVVSKEMMAKATQQ